jgi:hypothetical protein
MEKICTKNRANEASDQGEYLIPPKFTRRSFLRGISRFLGASIGL